MAATGRLRCRVPLPVRQPVAVELKCGDTNDTFGPCAWDALKLALALQSGAISEAFLVAATTADQWTKPVRGAEFFETGRMESLALRERFADWWRHWEKRGDPQPTSVPSHFATRAVGRFPFSACETTWELRVAAVLAAGQDRVGWPSS